MTQDIFIIDTLRTAIGNYNGSLSKFLAPDLAGMLIKEFSDRYPFIKDNTNHVLIGNNVSAGTGENPARQAAISGGLNVNINSFTLNQVCGSGLAALLTASAFIKSGDADLIIAGGTESCSNMPLLVDRKADKENLNADNFTDSLQRDGLFCAIHDVPMGEIADNFAKKHNISREMQDDLALKSQQKAKTATEENKFKNEILPIKTDNDTTFANDEKIRNTSEKKLARLKPSFTEDGTVTAGNVGGLCDGAAVSLIASAKAVKEHNLKPMAQIIDILSLGCELKEGFMGLSMVSEKILKRNDLTTDDIDLFEVCESFACAVNSFMQNNADISEDKINIYGGDIALGHPLGASGSRILTTLTHSLINNGKKYGLAIISMGGGHTTGVLIKTV